MWVYGDSLQPNLVAVAVPDPEGVLADNRFRGQAADVAALCSYPAFIAAVLQQMKEAGVQAGLKGFEQVRCLGLLPLNSDICIFVFLFFG